MSQVLNDHLTPLHIHIAVDERGQLSAVDLDLRQLFEDGRRDGLLLGLDAVEMNLVEGHVQVAHQIPQRLHESPETVVHEDEVLLSSGLYVHLYFNFI